MKISISEDNILNKEAKIYSELQSNSPEWWKTVKEDKELYLDIRKEDIIDIYYLGSRLAELKYDRVTKHIRTTAHPKYVGKCDKSDNSAYRKRLRKGKIVYDPIYQDCESWLMPDKIAELKANVREYYVKIQRTTTL